MGIYVLLFLCIKSTGLTIPCSGIISPPSQTWKTTPMTKKTMIQQPGSKMIKMMDAKDKILSSQMLKIFQTYFESTNPGCIITHSIYEEIGILLLLYDIRD